MYGYNENNGLIYNGQERLDEIDNRIMSRNIPSSDLERVYDPRPSHTRRRFYPTIDKQGYNSALPKHGIYNQNNVFNPGTSAPYSGYAKFIDSENSLKNIFHPLQKGSIQGKFVPSSNSDMYKVNMGNSLGSNKNNENKHSLLFKDYNKFNEYNPNTNNLGFETFNNHTRQQRRNLPLNE